MNSNRPFWIFVFSLFSILKLHSQCTDGSQPECTCATAPVLCTVDELDGYMYSMTNYQHPWDGPSPICPNTNSVTNNPTWFAFTAWCTDLDLLVSVTNCTPVGGFIGIQLAIFTDCTFTNPVACNVSPADCNTNDKTLNLTGLVIGDVYYFIVDGCLGSYCDVTIDVIGVCGAEEIEDWTNPVAGETEVCAGDTELYTVDDLAGAYTFHWFVDGVLYGTSNDPFNNINWPNAGTFELCIDASNDPCVPITDDPVQNCVSITVYESDAGTLTVNPAILCPNDVADITVSGYNTAPGYAQEILITDPSGVIIDILNPPTSTFTHDQCASFMVCSYNYVSGYGTAPVIGQNINNVDCGDECCEVECTPLVFEDDIAPDFPNAPGDVTYSCIDLLPPLANQDWMDNCDGTGSVAGSESGSADICNGGSITRTWMHTDICGNLGTYTQTITVDPFVIPSFTSPPGDMTINCDAIPANGPNLDYTNNGTGSCLEAGSVMPVESGSYDLCGGTLTYTWDYTDGCGNFINHVQNLTINPAPPVAFINPPADVTLSCDMIPSGAPDLEYSNGAAGSCLFTGFVSPMMSGSADECGGMITFTWDYTDACGNNIKHIQHVSIDPAPVPAFINPPANVTITCDQLPPTPPTLDYSNGSTGICLFEGTVAPTIQGTADECGGALNYKWEFTDPCGNFISHTQAVTVQPPPPTAFINPPANVTISCDQVPPSPPTLDYSNGGAGACLFEGSVAPTIQGSADECGGALTYKWEFTDPCGVLISHTQSVNVTPPPPTAFINPPANVTISCDQVPPSPPTLDYSNGGAGACLFEGSVVPTIQGSADECGGALTYKWEFTDPCGVLISHTQSVNVTPPPPTAFINPPADVTITCDQVPPSPPSLDYSNGGSGACLFEGTVTPNVQGSADECGGILNYVWEYTDPCGNTISHTQSVTVEPPPPLAFDNPPTDVTITCDQLPPSPPDLDYSNNGAGACLFEGTVSPNVQGNADECGGTLNYVWEYTDPCGNTISHTQSVTVEPPPPLAFDNPPADVTITCDQLPPSPPDLDYSNNGAGACLFEGTVSPNVQGNADECGGTLNYVWEYTDPCGNTISHTQSVTVEPPPPLAFDNPPADVTITCDQLPPSPPDLDYSNNGAGACLFEGTVSPNVQGNADECGGTLTYIWEFTDPCGNTISHNQSITVEPPPPASFIDPPSDITISCDDIPPSPPDLNYSNGGAGACLFEGIAAPSSSGSADECGGTISYTWNYTDPCGNTISHIQNIVVEPADQAVFLDPPANITVSCDNVPPNAPNLDFTNGSSGICLIEGNVPATLQGVPGPCGQQISFIWNYTDACNRTISHVQNIFIDPAPEADFINPPDDITVSCENIPLSPPDLEYTNGQGGDCEIAGFIPGIPSGTVAECGGTFEYIWTFTDECGRTIQHIQTITVDPAPMATFINPPADVTLDCNQFPNAPPTLNYDNNADGICSISGTVVGIQVGPQVVCGGEIQFLFSFTDNCGRNIEYIQNVTVTPADEASFINPPADITLDCSAVNLNPPSLTYTNGETGLCLISGSVAANQTGNYDVCGGVIQYTWSFTDVCNRTITHSQNIIVNPAPPAYFLNPPADLVLECGEPYNGPPDLVYTNEADAPCSILGVVSPSVEINGNIYTYTWAFTDPCTGLDEQHVQTVELSPTPDLVIAPILVNICLGDSYDLSTILVLDQNNTNPEITYHTGTPPTPANEITNLVVTPAVTSTYYIYAINEYGCADIKEFFIVVNDLPYAGEDAQDQICENTVFVDMFSYLPGITDFTGLWEDLDLTGVNLSNPFNVNFNFVPPGSYDFSYTVGGGANCPEDEAIVTITVMESPDMLIDSVVCQPGFQFYTVYISAPAGLIIGTSQGNINQNGTIVLITDIPAGQNVVVTGTDPANSCYTVLSINEPDCNCPDILPPVSNGDAAICFGDSIPELSVSVDPNNTAFWYDDPVAGNLLLDSSLVFTPDVSLPGSYTYFVETVSLVDFGCTSDTRTPVTLTIHDIPEANDADLFACDTDSDGLYLFDLTSAYAQINNDPSVIISFYETAENAQNGTDPINTDYTNIVAFGQQLFVVVENEFGCVSMSILNLHVGEEPVFSITVTDEICLDDQNGALTIQYAGNQPGILYSLDNANWQTDTFYSPLDPGSYTIYAQDSNGCVSSTNFSIEQGLEISLTDFEVSCHNNGTLSDGTDDYYTIIFEVTNNAGLSQSFDLFIDGNLESTFDYNLIDSVIIPADGSSPQLVFTDSSGNCPITEDIGPLNPCSTDCALSINTLLFECNDAGTPVDNSDDYYVISVNLSAINGSADNSFNVLVENIFLVNLPYDTDTSFVLLADGTSPVITFVDAEDVQCFELMNSVPLTPCSFDCLLTLNSISFECNNAGTDTDDSDDYFIISVNASAINGSADASFDVFINNIFLVNLPYDTDTSFVLPADGTAPLISLTDADDADCSQNINSNPLNPCSSACDLILNSINFICMDAGTPIDPIDDFYTIQFNATANNGSSDNQFLVWMDSVFIDSFSYGMDTSFTWPADGSSPLISFVDAADTLCTETVNSLPLIPCFNDCIFEVQISNIVCNDNGTQEIVEDDVFYFDILVTGFNTGSGWVISSIPDSGEYNISQTLGPFSIADGDITLTVSDLDSLDCTVIIDILAPDPCSDPCSIEYLNLNVSDCFDNNTGTTADDDYFEIEFMVNTLTGSTNMCLVIIGNDTLGPFNYNDIIQINDLTADGTDILVTIIDQDVQNCFTSFMVAQGPCSSCPQSMDAGMGGTLSCAVTQWTLTGTTSEPGTYLWTGPNNYMNDSLQIHVDVPGLYVLEVIYLNGCVFQDSVLVDQDIDLLVANVMVNGFITCDIDSVLVDGSASTSGQDIQSTWTGESGEFISNEISFYTDSAGIYNLQLINTSNGCESNLASAVVQSNHNNPLAIIYADPGDILNCIVQNVILSGEPQDNVIFIWTVNNSDIQSDQLVIYEPGTIGLLVIDTINGCTNNNSIEIQDLQNYPIINIAPVDELDCVQLSVQIDATGSQSGPDIIYNWYDDTGLIGTNIDAEITVDEEGWYYFESVDTVNGCINLDSVYVLDISALPEFLSGDDVMLPCDDNTSALYIEINGDPNDYDILWTAIDGGSILSGNGSEEINIIGSGNYIVEVTDPVNNCMETDTISVLDQDQFPQLAQMAIDSIDCYGDSDGIITIENIVGGTGPYQIFVNGELSNNNITGLSAGTYEIEIVDTNGCVLDTSVVLEEGLDLQIYLDPSLEIKVGEQGQLEANVNIDSNLLEIIQWTPSDFLSCDTCLITFVQGSITQTYTIVVQTEEGCEATATIQLVVRQETEINVPNIFSPNDDGINDGFTLYANDAVEEILSMRIFDRWGEQIFLKEHFAPNIPALGWDGTFKGRNAALGVYAYMFELKMTNGSKQYVAGDVTLIR